MSIDFTLKPVDQKKVRRTRRKREVKVQEEDVSQSKLVDKMEGPITREELGSWLWGAADILRGAVSADDYGDFVLPLMFYKRLSDNYSCEYQQRLAKYGEERVAKDAMFYRAVVPDGCLWEDVRKTATNVGAKLNDVLNSIAKANPKLDRVINRTDFNNPNAIPEERLIRLIEHLNQKNLANGNVSPDILGDGYEYLLKKFNEVAPTRAGEFYTPREVVKVLVGCLKPEEGMEIYDPCCGSGGMLIESYYYLKEQDRDPKKLFLFGQEINDDTWAIAKMNEFLHDMEANIVQGDTFVNPKFLHEGGLKQFDIVIANPMWNQKKFKQYMEDDQYGRFKHGIAPNGSADWGWIQHMLASLKPEGRMGIVLDQGALYRGNVEKRIRKSIIEEDLIEAVIALPKNLFYNTGGWGCLIIFNKNKKAKKKKNIVFIYAEDNFEDVRNMNKLRESDITIIIETFFTYQEMDGFSKIVSLNEIREKNYSLNVTRYLDVFGDIKKFDVKESYNELLSAYNDFDTQKKIIDKILKLMNLNYNKDAYDLNLCEVWEDKKLKTIITKIKNGINIPQIDYITKYPITRIETISEGYINPNRVKYIDDISEEDYNKYSIHNGDILFSHINSIAHLAKTAIYKGVPTNLIHGINLLLLRPSKNIDPYFLFNVLNYEQIKIKIKSLAKKAVNQASISIADLGEIKLKVPVFEEQKAISTILKEIDTLLERNNEVQKNINVLKQAILQSLLSGKVRFEMMEDGLHRIGDS